MGARAADTPPRCIRATERGGAGLERGGEEVYPEPARFRPERFLERPQSGYTWIAFGGCDRHCIGRSFATAEFKLALRTIVRQLRLEPTDPADEKIVRRGILFAPAAGARGVVRERSGTQVPHAA
jgi:cytochrome P450